MRHNAFIRHPFDLTKQEFNMLVAECKAWITCPEHYIQVKLTHVTAGLYFDQTVVYVGIKGKCPKCGKRHEQRRAAHTFKIKAGPVDPLVQVRKKIRKNNRKKKS